VFSEPSPKTPRNAAFSADSHRFSAPFRSAVIALLPYRGAGERAIWFFLRKF
jgi:hypothetical protein